MVTLTSKPKVLPPQGTHTAILYQIIDLGTQKTEYQGQVKFVRKFRMAWELCEELMEDGRAFAISKNYNASADPKSSIVKDIKAWTGQDVANGFKVESLLGKACNLTIVHEEGREGQVYANVVAIAPLKKSETPPPQRNASVHFDLDRFNPIVFENLPDFMKEMITKSPEYAEATSGKPSPKSEDDYPGFGDSPPAHVLEGPGY